MAAEKTICASRLRLEGWMFQFLFKYPVPVFTKGRFVLLAGWPAWALAVLIAATAGGLALLIRWRLRRATPKLRSWRGWLIWALQSALVAARALSALAAGNARERVELAAEHHRRGRGRFAQHAHRRQRREDARSRGDCGPRGRCSRWTPETFPDTSVSVGQCAHTSRQAAGDRASRSGHAY